MSLMVMWRGIYFCLAIHASSKMQVVYIHISILNLSPQYLGCVGLCAKTLLQGLILLIGN